MILSIGAGTYAAQEPGPEQLLLKDYRPRSIYNIPQTKLAKARFPVVDIHCHWSLAEDPAGILRAMDELGMKAAVNLSGGYGEDLDRMLTRFHAAAPGNWRAKPCHWIGSPAGG